MQFSTSAYLSALLTTASAFPSFHPVPGSSQNKNAPNRVIARQACGSVWYKIGRQFASEYVDDEGECNDAARGAIRLAFHDCFSGACDGSIVLGDECGRKENRGLQETCDRIGSYAKEMDVGVADLIQFAGGENSPFAFFLSPPQ